MKSLTLSDNQIITMADYPIYDLLDGDGVILKLYFRIFQKKCQNIIAPITVLPKEIIVASFSPSIKKKFELFEKNHPKAIYFALDGNHRSTAASLTHSTIPAMLLETDADCTDIQKNNNTPGVFRPYTNNTIDEYVLELKDHFKNVKEFYTVRTKTEKMVQDKALSMPQYMRDGFCEKRGAI